MKKPYAFFDVDGTVISRDSFMLILKEGLKRSPWRAGFLLLFCPVYVLTPLLSLDKKYAKSATLWLLTVGRGRKGAVSFLRDLLLPHWDSLWFPEMNSTLEELRSAGIAICYVSASGQIWVRSLVRKMDPGPKVVIGSKLGFALGGVVMRSRNCFSQEKVQRIGAMLGSDLEWHSGFSDHTADLPMLTPCARRYLISPQARHIVNYKKAFGENFKLLKWTSKFTAVW